MDTDVGVILGKRALRCQWFIRLPHVFKVVDVTVLLSVRRLSLPGCRVRRAHAGACVVRVWTRSPGGRTSGRDVGLDAGTEPAARLPGRLVLRHLHHLLPARHSQA